ncbi:MAG: protease complex subunit PrcB family protein [Desulfotomaculum sp.]|nr:protease complex subunit PrcB family protein [Desulfotomaculum sp.]
MKRFLTALALGSLLVVLPVAYGTATEQSWTDPGVNKYQPNKNIPVTQHNKTKFAPASGKKITCGEFARVLADTTGVNTGDLGLKSENPITLETAAGAVLEVIKNKGIDIAAFSDPGELDDPLATAKKLGLVNNTDTDNQKRCLDIKTLEKIIDNLLLTLDFQEGKENSYGVSYMLTPQPQGYKLELMWGKKPSSGYEIKIKETLVKNNTLYVKYETSEPQPGAAYLTVITYPSDFKVIDIEQKPDRVVLVKENI